MIKELFSRVVRQVIGEWMGSVSNEQALSCLEDPSILTCTVVPLIEQAMNNAGYSCNDVRALAWNQPFLQLESVFDSSVLPETPVAFCPVPDSTGTILARITAIACLAAIDSTAVSYGSENGGSLFVNLVVLPPGQGTFTDKSAAKMSGHTDAVSFPMRGLRDPSDHRIAPSPDFVCLSALRNPKGVPTKVMPLAGLLEQLSEAHINELQKQQYIVGSQLTFRRGMVDILGDELIVDDAQLIFRVNDDWWIRFSHSVTLTADGDPGPAQAAMDALKDACASCVISVPLNPGDIALVNNRIALHGRGEPGPEYGVETRWLLRTYGLDVSFVDQEQRYEGSAFMLYP